RNRRDLVETSSGGGSRVFWRAAPDVGRGGPGGGGIEGGSNGERVIAALPRVPGRVQDSAQTALCRCDSAQRDRQDPAQSDPRLGPLLGPATVVLTAQNGIPWWYFQCTEGPLAGTHLRSVDPDGTLASSIDIARVVGCIVYPATRVVSPGVIEHVEGSRFSLG